LPESIVVSGVGILNGTYKLTMEDNTVFPEWFTEGQSLPKNTENQIIQFGGSIVCGSTPECKGTKKDDTCSKCAKPWRTIVIDQFDVNSWKTYAGDRWYVNNANKSQCIFFDQNQKKWHICDDQKLYYRGNNKGTPLPFLNPKLGWYHDTGYSLKGTCQKCKATKVKAPNGTHDGCGGSVVFPTKPIFACGVEVDGKVKKITVRPFLADDYKELPEVVSINVTGLEKLNGTYKRTSEGRPKWFTEQLQKNPKNKYTEFNESGQIKQFGGSNAVTIEEFSDDSWKKHAGEKWYVNSDKSTCIFFDHTQLKWHVCDDQELYYRGNDAAYKYGKTLLPFPKLDPNTGWYHDTGKSNKGTCPKCKSKGPNGSECCGNTLTADVKAIFACGVKVDGEVEKLSVDVGPVS